MSDEEYTPSEQKAYERGFLDGIFVALLEDVAGEVGKLKAEVQSFRDASTAYPAPALPGVYLSSDLPGD